MICIQGAAAVTHFRCLNFSPALNFVLSLLVVRLILSRRHIPQAHDFEAFRLLGIRLPRGIGANQLSSRVLHFRIAQDADHGATVSPCGRMSRRCSMRSRPAPNFLSPPMRCDKPLLETINSHASSRFEVDRVCQEAIQAVAETLLQVLNPTLLLDTRVSFFP